MSLYGDYLRAMRYPSSHRGLSRNFFCSGLFLVGFFTAAWLWSRTAQCLMNDKLWALGYWANPESQTRPYGIVTLNGGGVLIGLMVVGMLWLFMTGYASRGTMLRLRDRRIAELEARPGGQSSS